MKIKDLHHEIIAEIIKNSGKPTQHTFLDGYLGNNHFRYAISTPLLRSIAKRWMNANRGLTQQQFLSLQTSLLESHSSTEKVLAGILLDYADRELIQFDPLIIDEWLNHVQGWAEVDALCYGHFACDQIMEDCRNWKSLLIDLNKSKNIHKRRASLVLLCKALTQTDDEGIQALSFKLIGQLKHEKEILITKAVSWTLRSMIKRHRKAVTDFVEQNRDSLPAIAVRETLTKLKTGRKT